MSIKDDLLKKINAKVERKKQLAKEVSKEKTLTHWIAEFFREVEKWHEFGPFNLVALQRRIRAMDYHARVYFNPGENPTIEIHWSKQYAETEGIEDTMVFDSVSAIFQDEMDKLIE